MKNLDLDKFGVREMADNELLAIEGGSIFSKAWDGIKSGAEKVWQCIKNGWEDGKTYY